MSYQALYRVWRPQRFDEVIGQPLITRTLKNAIKTNQISHAYLFAGPRGTGKTSMAKIFAKAVNCRFQKNGEPCNECDTCRAITAGTLNDVIEIDAASNNGVEEIRDIRDKVKYAPTEADYKVYIIDEVHMLSTGAFNALLKTLEEPPANVIFILATTEPHKIPATIISRTQRFDFKQIQTRDSLDRMVTILKDKQLDYDPEALKVIAKASEGGMRDALSILDQAISFGDDKVTLENALLVTGAVRQTLLVDYLSAVTQDQTKEGLVAVHKILADGKDPERFIEDLINVTRDLLLYQQAPEMVEDIELDQVDDQFKKLADGVSEQRLYKMIDELNDIQKQMRFSTHEDVYLEVLTVKLVGVKTAEEPPVSAGPVADSSAVKQLTAQVKTLTDQLASLKKQADQSPQRQPEATPAPKPAPNPAAKVRVNLQKIYPILQQATKEALVEIQQNWGDLMQFLSVTQRAMMHVSKPVAASPEGVIVAFDYVFLLQRANGDQELIDALQNGLDRLMGKVSDIVFVPADEWPQIRQTFIQQYKAGQLSEPGQNSSGESDETADDSAEDPVVTKAQDLFGDDVIEIKKD
ncbi:DNA polymerase III subunit gamma/tau [Secundilactobacillus kimchicus]|uniref:DNA polymerase III subunit gamma/tau n=1 Tax=Secundilactobacillus kimchicus TaxID=528209 RepID=UPI0024A9CF51|nr:DNA polymerase III subunit gamma/tau [Secundilactobacillus kimchicus]